MAMRTLADRAPWIVALAAVAVLLIAATGFCVFDMDGDSHDGVGLDLCIGIIAVSPGVLLFIALGPAGSTGERLGWAATPANVPVLDPPPWRILSVSA
jgi:hypothetical protein